MTATLAQDFPILNPPAITIVVGDDYSASNGTQIDFNVTGSSVDLTAVSVDQVLIYFYFPHPPLNFVFYALTPSGAIGNQTLRFECTSTNTAVFAGISSATYKILFTISGVQTTICRGGTVSIITR